MVKSLKIISTLLLCALTAILIYLNLKLYYQPEARIVEAEAINYDLLQELRFIKSSIRNGADRDMQQLFPEGQVFMNALYGLSWCEFSMGLKDDTNLYKEAQVEIVKAYQRIDSDECRVIFNEYTPLPYGAFYNGWRNYLLGKRLSVINPLKRDSTDIAIFKEQCEQIATAMNSKGTPYAASYSNGAWPADMMVCIASLAIHDKLFEPTYQDGIEQWISRVKMNLDGHGLVPHAVHPLSGKLLEPARGSSQSLTLCFLSEIDPEFGAGQYAIYKDLFVDDKFGLKGIREYRKGFSGTGDIDSGPVVMSIGASASIVGIRAAALYKDTQVSIALRNGIEAFGCTTYVGNTKRYLFGQLPIVDAFMAWSHAVELPSETSQKSNNWMKFHLYSFSICAVLMMTSMFIWGFRFRVKKVK